MSSCPNILFVDAYDSFSASIAALLRQLLDAAVVTIRIDTDIESEFLLDKNLFLQSFDAVVLGPGPGHPENSSDIGIFNTIWSLAEIHNIPVLGICLGFQSLCSRYGFSVERLPLPCHGHAKPMIHANTDIFQGVGNIIATQYNSLGIRPIQNSLWCREVTSKYQKPDPCFGWDAMIVDQSCERSGQSSSDSNTFTKSDLQLLAWDENGYTMAVKHRSLPLWGFQFHPESCESSNSCRDLLERWWKQVNRHNQLCRPPRPPLKISEPEGPIERPFGGPAAKLLARLEELSRMSTNSSNHLSVSTTYQREQLADLCYEMSGCEDVIMLESTKKGRFCIYGLPDKATWRIEFSKKSCTIRQGSNAERIEGVCTDDMLSVLETFLITKKVEAGPADLPFWGGLVGFMSYEFGLELLDSRGDSEASSNYTVPQISLSWIDRSAVLDLETGRVTLQSLRENDSWAQDMAIMLQKPKEFASTLDGSKAASILSSANIKGPNHNNYISQIQSCQSELLAGNSYELCLTTEATVTTRTGADYPYILYKNLQRHNPVPFAAYLQLGDTTLLSSSPERFLAWSRRGTLDMVPMKGTVKKTSGITLEKATIILSTPKETAENLMIADLIRHDLYSATNHGDAKVEVVKLCEVVEHETVYQLVSHIRAHTKFKPAMIEAQRLDTVIKSGCRTLRSTLPPGSMTGAPKKRSCEVLRRLENRKRGLYSGVIGYLDVGGGGSWSVCIRSAFSNKAENRDGKQTWHIGAGGAITVLSDDEEEWQEMITKLDSVLKAFRSV